jgi:hypothetical protein
MPGPERDGRFRAKYVSLTTFKRDGTGVSTDPHSFKVKRIRRNPAVMIAPCTATRRLRGDSVPANVELLPPSQLEHGFRRLRGAHQGAESVGLAITPLSISKQPTHSTDPS